MTTRQTFACYTVTNMATNRTLALMTEPSYPSTAKMINDLVNLAEDFDEETLLSLVKEYRKLFYSSLQTDELKQEWQASCG